MIFFYRLFFIPLFLLSAPFYLRRKLRRDKNIRQWPQYLGFFPKISHTAKDRTKKRIWVQAVSVGEVLAIEPLIRQLHASADVEIILTTTTSTGYKEAKKRYSDISSGIGLFPMDFWLCSTLAWSRIQPDVVILAESELWPEHLHQASKKSVPVFLINARLSDRSYARLKRFHFMACYFIETIETIYCATQIDYDRFSDLGAIPEGRIGNIKLDVDFGPALSLEDKCAQLQTMGFERNNDSTENSFTLIGASTWPGEETLLLNAQKYCLDAGIPCELILVPRHVERREAIQKLLNEQPLSWSSANGDSGNLPINNDSNQAIFFSDTTGNLVHLLKLADLAFIGKSMPPNDGGQTPIEAVAQGIPILFGPNMSNFKTISGELLEVGAARCISSQSELNEQVLRLAKDSQTRGQMKEAGLNWHEANKGIIADIGNAILQTLKLS